MTALDTTIEMRRCSGGPLADKLVDARLGTEWPAVVFWDYGAPTALIGTYSLIASGGYEWRPETVRGWVRP